MSRFRKISTLIIIALTLTLYCSTQAAHHLGVGKKKSLWRVRSQSNTIYLQGSIHLLKSDNYPLDPSIEEALKDSQVLVLEADLRTMGDPKVQQLMITKGILPQGSSLESQLSRETYVLAKKEMQELGVDISLFKQFKPWMFAMTVTVTRLQRLGFNSQYGVDMYLMSQAINTGKEIMGLEKLEYQVELLDTLTAREQDALVRQTFQDLDIIEEKVNSIVAAWSIGDVNTMEAIMLESFRKYPAIYRHLIANRNENWVSQIESFLKRRDNYMVVVGVLHLIGEDGLVKVLRRKGYIVDQM